MRGLLSRLLGNKGERLAAKHLCRQGFRILARQYSTPPGEIDLIARDGNTIVFVEVKTRRSTSAGHPLEAITPAKQQQLTRLALAWLKRHRLLNHRARFDVVAIVWPDDDNEIDIQHVKNAFEATGCG